MRVLFVLFTLASLGACANEPLPPPRVVAARPVESRDASTVIGRVLGWGHGVEKPLGDVTVAVLGDLARAATTDAAGRFRLDGVPSTFDVVLVVTRPRVWGDIEPGVTTKQDGVEVHVFNDLTRRDVTFHVPVDAIERHYGAQIQLGPSLAQPVAVDIATRGRLHPLGSFGDPRVSELWYGAPTLAGTAYALAYDEGSFPQTGRAVRFRAFGHADLELSDGGTPRLDVAMTPIGTRMVRVKIENKRDDPSAVVAYWEPAPGVRVPLQRPGTTVGDAEFDQPAPACPCPLVVRAWTSGAGRLASWAQTEARVAPDAAAVTIRLPERVVATGILGSDEASESPLVARATRFTWTGAGVAVLQLRDHGIAPGARHVRAYRFVTARGRAEIPDLRALDVSLPPQSHLESRVFVYPLLASVDGTAKAGDPLAPDSGAPVTWTSEVSLTTGDEAL